VPNVRTQSGVVRRDKLRLAVGGRSPDQFRLSRLKEGERVCGGRGQFGKEPLWNLNTFLKLRMRLVRCGVFNLTSWKHPRKAGYPVFSHDNVPENAEMAVRTVIGTHR
jgi:hypothetical protein